MLILVNNCATLLQKALEVYAAPGKLEKSGSKKYWKVCKTKEMSE